MCEFVLWGLVITDGLPVCASPLTHPHAAEWALGSLLTSMALSLRLGPLSSWTSLVGIETDSLSRLLAYVLQQVTTELLGSNCGDITMRWVFPAENRLRPINLCMGVYRTAISWKPIDWVTEFKALSLLSMLWEKMLCFHLVIMQPNQKCHFSTSPS